MLKQFLSKQPISVVQGTRINDSLVRIPGCISTLEFGKEMKDEVNKEGLTPEKAIYAASREPRTKFITSRDILSSRLKQSLSNGTKY